MKFVFLGAIALMAGTAAALSIEGPMENEQQQQVKPLTEEQIYKIEAAKCEADGKALVAIIYSDGCPPCHKLKEDVKRQKGVKFIHNKVRIVFIKHGTRPHRELLGHRQIGTPTTVRVRWKEEKGVEGKVRHVAFRVGYDGHIIRWQTFVLGGI